MKLVNADIVDRLMKIGFKPRKMYSADRFWNTDWENPSIVKPTIYEVEEFLLDNFELRISILPKEYPSFGYKAYVFNDKSHKRIVERTTQKDDYNIVYDEVLNVALDVAFNHYNYKNKRYEN